MVTWSFIASLQTSAILTGTEEGWFWQGQQSATLQSFFFLTIPLLSNHSLLLSLPYLAILRTPDHVWLARERERESYSKESHICRHQHVMLKLLHMISLLIIFSLMSLIKMWYVKHNIYRPFGRNTTEFWKLYCLVLFKNTEEGTW